MTATTTRPTGATGSSSDQERHDARAAIRARLPSGWYDPDGAAWEAESQPPLEAFRATPVRPPVRSSVRPPIRVEGVDRPAGN